MIIISEADIHNLFIFKRLFYLKNQKVIFMSYFRAAMSDLLIGYRSLKKTIKEGDLKRASGLVKAFAAGSLNNAQLKKDAERIEALLKKGDVLSHDDKNEVIRKILAMQEELRIKKQATRYLEKNLVRLKKKVM